MRDWREVVRDHVSLARLGPVSEADLIDELAQHLEQRYEELIAAGVAPSAAEREALAELGTGRDIVRAARAARGGYVEPAPVGSVGGSFVTGLGNDVRIAFRLLRRNPGFALAAIVTLAIGIGANTAIFGMVDAVLLRGWPFADPDRLVIVWETDRASGTVHEPASWPDIADFRERSRSLEAIAAFTALDATLSGADEEPVRATGVGVTPNFFELLGVRAILGTTFRADDGLYGGAGLTAVLSEALWRSRFNADSGVVGRSILVNEIGAVIVGVVPANADLGIRQVHTRADYGAPFTSTRADVWLSMQPTATSFPRSTHPFFTLARLAPGSTVAAAQRELTALAAELERAYPDNAERGVNVQSFGDVVFGPVRASMLLLLVAVALVLIVTCANVANLLLARTSERMREVAVRRALGASSVHIGRQLFAEGLVLTSIGAFVGVALAWLALRVIVGLAPADVPRLTHATLDGRVLAFTVLVTLFVALVFGAIPAVRLRSSALRGALQAQPGRITEGAAGRHLRAALVVGQVALAVALFAGAGLLLRSYAALHAIDPGFRTEQVLKAEYQLPDSRYPSNRASWPDLPAINNFHASLLQSVAALPGVRSAALAARHPLDPGFTNSFLIVGREAESADYPEIRTRFISAGYLGTVGVPLLDGRDITTTDVAGTTPVGLLNRSAAERYFAGRDPIGQRLRFWGVNWLVVGVIGDERFRGIDQESEPAIYSPLAQAPQSRVTLLVRTAQDPVGVVPQVRNALRALDPAIPLFGIEPLATTVSATIAQPRFTTALLGTFSAVTVLLALIGVHGLLAYTVAQRTRELGIRMALGATAREIRAMILGHGVRLAAIGIVLGVGIALLGTRLLASLLFGVSPTDPATFAIVTLAVLGTAAAAAWLPARRATSVDPMEALRE